MLLHIHTASFVLCFCVTCTYAHTHPSKFYPIVMVVGKVATKVEGHLTGINVAFQFVYVRHHDGLIGQEGGRERRGKEVDTEEG